MPVGGGGLLPMAGTYGTSMLPHQFSMISTGTTEAIATASETVPAFASPTIEEHGFMVDATNRRIYITGIPRGAVCAIAAGCGWAASDAGVRYLSGVFSGGTSWTDITLPAGGVIWRNQIFYPFVVNTADTYVEIRVYQNSGGNLNLGSTYFSVMRLR